MYRTKTESVDGNPAYGTFTVDSGTKLAVTVSDQGLLHVHVALRSILISHRRTPTLS